MAEQDEGIRRPQAENAQSANLGILSGIRVIEVCDETAEYCGLVLAGLGAEVIKIEPPNGSRSRNFGPFYGNDPDPERSLFFFAYNRGKKSVLLDLETDLGRRAFFALIETADVLLSSSHGPLIEPLGQTWQQLLRRHQTLVTARLTPFGDHGPWRDFRGSDLVHLALGGVMMNCGYDPEPSGRYDLPPIAPQFWHAYQIAGDQLVIGILAALLHRQSTGMGQDVSCAVHEAVAKNTELDVMSWVMRRAPLYRQTCRHATQAPDHVPNICHTKDGRWFMTGLNQDLAKIIPFLEGYGMAADLAVPSDTAKDQARRIPGTTAIDEKIAHVTNVTQRFIRSYAYENVPWREAQAAGLLWAPLRKPHENAVDEHWLKRGTFADVDHPELGHSLRYPISKWHGSATAWQAGPRAPLIDEDKDAVFDQAGLPHPREPAFTHPRSGEQWAGDRRISPHGRPFALQGIRVLDFSWFLASAGGTRFLAGLGAECLKVEWKGNPDTRLAAMAPVGGRAAREKATAPLPGVDDPDMGGQFHNKNSGKHGISLNIRHPKGLQIAKQLVAVSDVVAEGFSPGVLERLGLGYEVMKAIKPDIIYVQQSGMGSFGTYGRLRTVGPVAAAFAGTSEMSGLPEPAMPAGWGYSYLDWIGAYGFATAILGALLHRERTGQGQWIDSSQCEAGIFLNALPILDWSANDRVWSRTGNRSPYRPAAPHGAYRCKGDDRWIAIACFDQSDWSSLVGAAEHPAWADDPRFATLERRVAHQDALDAALTSWTLTQDAYDCMYRLQRASVPAGVCQTAEDRCDRDPQLAALTWLTEVAGTKIGTWPVPELPIKLSATPSYIGGTIDRGAPCYGEDNFYVLRDLLRYSQDEIERFAREGII